MTERIRIVVADDHPSFRESLISPPLTRRGDRSRQGKRPTEWKRTVWHSVFKPDVVVLDLKMPEVDGAEATRRIKAAASEVQVIVLSVFSQADRIRRCLEAGADRYLTKGISREELLAAVEAVEVRGAHAADGRPEVASEVSEAETW